MSVAKAYAKALYESARDAQVTSADLEKFDAQLSAFAHMMETSADARAALTGPMMSAEDKAQMIQTLARKFGAASQVANFVTLMARKGRLDILPAVRDAFSAVRLEAEGGVLGAVVSADPMEKGDLDGLASAFSQKLGKKVAFRTSTDPSLLAGMKVSVNGVTYDGSLRAQLSRLRDKLVLE
jgi:F-type H+-transporting ATPase subunit delta